MERRMSLSTDVIRFLTLRVEAHETEQSVQMRKSDDRRDGERGAGGFRGGDRGGFRGGERGGFRGDREGGAGGFRGGDREGGSTFRARPAGAGGFRDGAPRPPRAPRDTQSGSEE
jgi:small subunit ribosomal protein S6